MKAIVPASFVAACFAVTVGVVVGAKIATTTTIEVSSFDEARRIKNVGIINIPDAQITDIRAWTDGKSYIRFNDVTCINGVIGSESKLLSVGGEINLQVRELDNSGYSFDCRVVAK